MPSLVESYDVLLDIINDTSDSVSVQLLRDYGRNPGAVVLLHPTESVMLVLESGSSYRYAFKSRTRVANVTVRSWRDIQCYISHLIAVNSEGSPSSNRDQAGNGVTVDRLWRDYQFCIWPEL